MNNYISNHIQQPYLGPTTNDQSTGEDALPQSSPTPRVSVVTAAASPPEAWLRVSLAHGSITLLAVWPSGKVSLLALGDTAALPTDQVTRSNAVVYNDN